MILKYRSKGIADDWTEDTIEAESKEEALQKLHEIYGVEAIKNKVVWVELIEEKS